MGRERQRDKDGELFGGFGGRQRHCEAPAEHDCITWVYKALGWDVVFNRGVAPQQKMLITPGVSRTVVMRANSLDRVESVVAVLLTVPTLYVYYCSVITANVFL